MSKRSGWIDDIPGTLLHGNTHRHTHNGQFAFSLISYNQPHLRYFTFSCNILPPFSKLLNIPLGSFSVQFCWAVFYFPDATLHSAQAVKKLGAHYKLFRSMILMNFSGIFLSPSIPLAPKGSFAWKRQRVGFSAALTHAPFPLC